MKCFIKLMMFFALSIQPMLAWAMECRVNEGQIFRVGTNNTTNASVQLNPNFGNVYSYGDLKLQCRYEIGSITNRADFIYTSADAFSLPFSQGIKGGLFINGAQIDMPVSGDIFVVKLNDDGNWYNVNVTPFIKPAEYPLSLNIGNNTNIGTLKLYQRSGLSNGQQDPNRNPLTINLISSTNITLWPNTCTINGGGPLDIDFGSVIDSKISTVPTALGQYTKPITFTYSCSDQTVTQVIGITLQAPDTASFNNNLIGTSNGALGIALVKGTSVVPVNSTYNSQMVNGSGSDHITFNLVRSLGQLPATGDFNASAVLQIGLP
ncbi:fimbrial protein [Serratia sp. JSRIV006]|uniref:fimbrial protein n=1 Tax=Serratia sp. JSRIV006 TaxID=2831896 RepID=UPI001CBD3723|nr:fimbrial protein [Serratia sp. JSRIV006]UAN62242.1 fimbrial protein [Serratia sp. JSRIV006]